MASYQLDIGYQVLGRVVRRPAERRRLPAPALVEEHDPIELRIEEAAMDRPRAAARAAMEKHYREPPRIPALLDVDRVAAADGQLLHCKRLQFGVQRLVGEPVHGIFTRGGIGRAYVKCLSRMARGHARLRKIISPDRAICRWAPGRRAVRIGA